MTYVGEVKLFAGNYAPQGWAFCNGQTVSVNDYQLLYSLLGTTYGGDGRTTFGLPNMQAHMGVGQGLSISGNNYAVGATGGVATVTLTEANLPAHSHNLTGTTAAATTGVPTNNLLATTNGNNSTLTPPYPDVKLYTTLPLPGSTDTQPGVTLNTGTVTSAGGNGPHNNMMPYITLSYIIALNGVYPTSS